MGMIVRTAAVALLALGAQPALAQVAIKVPEPADLALFAVGLAGLVIGRRSSRKRRPKE